MPVVVDVVGRDVEVKYVGKWDCENGDGEGDDDAEVDEECDCDSENDSVALALAMNGGCMVRVSGPSLGSDDESPAAESERGR